MLEAGISPRAGRRAAGRRESTPEHLHQTLAAHVCVSWMAQGGRGGQGGNTDLAKQATAGDPTRKRTDPVLSRCS